MKTNQKTIETDPQTRKIALLNDRLRQTFWGGKIMITAGHQHTRARYADADLRRRAQLQ